MSSLNDNTSSIIDVDESFFTRRRRRHRRLVYRIYDADSGRAHFYCENSMHVFDADAANVNHGRIFIEAGTAVCLVFVL